MISQDQLAEKLPLAIAQYEKLLTEASKGGTVADRDVIVDCFQQIMNLLEIDTHAEFARVINLQWVTFNRWMSKVNVPRPSHLEERLGKILRGEIPLYSESVSGVSCYSHGEFQFRLNSIKTHQLWVFLDPSDTSDLSELMLPDGETEHYFVYLADQPERFRRLQRKLERGGLGAGIGAQRLGGKVIGLAVEPTDYPMFLAGMKVCVAMGTETEGYLCLPLATAEDTSVQPRYLRVEQLTVRLWQEYMDQLTLWCQTHADKQKKVQELAVSYP